MYNGYQSDKMKAYTYQKHGIIPTGWSRLKLYKMCKQYPYTSEDPNELCYSPGLPWYARKWWQKTRETNVITNIEATLNSKNEVDIFYTNYIESYTPWWAKPLEFLYNIIFRLNKTQLN